MYCGPRITTLPPLFRSLSRSHALAPALALSYGTLFLGFSRYLVTLKSAGLLRGFGSIDFAKVPSKARDVSAEELLSLSGVQKQNLAPGRPTGSWLSAVRRSLRLSCRMCPFIVRGLLAVTFI